MKDLDRPLHPADIEINDALNRIYKKYGANLAAFFRDAHARIKKEAEEKLRNR